MNIYGSFMDIFDQKKTKTFMSKETKAFMSKTKVFCTFVLYCVRFALTLLPQFAICNSQYWNIHLYIL